MGKTWAVYVHTNNINGKKYVGITSKENPEHRWRSGNGYSENTHFRAAIKKYGWNGFKHEIIITGIKEQYAKEIERGLIKLWDTQNRLYGYNMTSGGDGTSDYHPSAETRAKLSEARRKENLSDETLRRRSEGLKGRKFTEEHKRKIGDGNSKAIKMYTKDGVFIRSFKAAREAEIEYGISHSHISQCCNGRRMSAGGYVWQFV